MACARWANISFPSARPLAFGGWARRFSHSLMYVALEPPTAPYSDDQGASPFCSSSGKERGLTCCEPTSGRPAGWYPSWYAAMSIAPSGGNDGAPGSDATLTLGRDLPFSALEPSPLASRRLKVGVQAVDHKGHGSRGLVPQGLLHQPLCIPVLVRRREVTPSDDEESLPRVEHQLD